MFLKSHDVWEYCRLCALNQYQRRYQQREIVKRLGVP